jgi:dephospho-CoA kinase
MKLIGITGGIGSGKSIVCKVFATMGIPIYEADSRAKALMNNDLALKKSIKNLLGESAYTPTGEYNRAWVASQVFNNPALLQKLNAIVHPRVREDADNWIKQNTNSPFLLYEAAIMKAAGDGNYFNKVIVVNAPIDLRIRRVQKRDNRSEQEIRDIMARQVSDEERLKIADFVIENNEQIPLLEQIISFYEGIKK